MAVTMADITKLRKLSGAGMMDCKKALEEANNDIEAAMEIIRKKGQAVAAKRSDREAAEGCVVAKAVDGFGAIIALKCETDFVAKNEDFMSGIVAPFIFIFLSGWWCFTDTRAAQTAWSTLGLQTTSTNGMGGSATEATAVLGFNNGLLFVLLGMLGGMLLYYLIDRLKNHKFSAGGKTALTIVNIAAAGLLLWYTVYPPTWFELDRWTVSLICIIVIGLSLLNVDGLTKLLNNKVTHSLFEYLGGISLYIYMLHYPVAILILRMLGQNTAETTFIFHLYYNFTTN